MELLAERFDRRRVAERGQPGLVHQVGRNAVYERSREISLHQLILDKWRLSVGALRQRIPTGGVNSAAWCELIRLLKGEEGALEIRAAASVNLAGRESDAIEHDLGRQRFVDDRGLRVGGLSRCRR